MDIELDSEAKVLKHAERVYQTSSVIRSMPLGNMTRITQQERKQIASWYANLQNTSEP